MRHRTAISVACALFLGTFAVYLLTLAPTIVFADTGELAVAAATGGVAHPPGFPLYLILAGLFSGLPIGDDVAYRLNLFSALAAALTAPVIYMTLRLALTAPRQPKGPPAPDGGWIRGHLAPACGALLFAFSLTFWQQATITEVYTLNMLMTGLAALFTVLHLRRAREGAARTWIPAALGLTAGLGVANHLTIGFALPGMALIVLAAPFRKRYPWARVIVIPLIAFVVGLSLYAVLPIRAASDPVLNWGDPDLGERFFRHVRGWQFKDIFNPSKETIEKQGVVFLQTSFREVGVLPIILLPAGILYLLRRDRLLLVGLGIIFMLPFCWALGYDIAEDQETYFLIPFLVLALVTASGVVLLMEEGSKILPGTAGRVYLVVFALLICASPLAWNFGRANRRHQTEAKAYGLDLLESVRPDAVVFTRYWNLYAPTLYLQHMEDVRRDVDVIDLNLLRYSWYVPYLRKSAPRCLAGLDDRIARFQRLQAIWERDDLPEKEKRELEKRYQSVIGGMLTGAWKGGRPVYATRRLLFEESPDALKRCGIRFVVVPETIAFRVFSEADYRGLEGPYPFPELRFRNRWERESSDPIAAKARTDYFLLRVNRGRFLEKTDRLEEAVRAFREADAVHPGREDVQKHLRRVESKISARGR